MNKESIWGANFRALTIGIVLVVTATAFEGLAVTTIAPGLSKELQGANLYGWIFSAYLLAQLIGTVITGQLVDKKGPAQPFITMILLFAVGIVVAAIAPNMPILLIGRILQGFGAGALINCVYTIITLRYPDSLRPQILAVFSSAYILPGLFGPYIAGLIAEQLSWRYVFWLILPFVILSAILTTPSFKGMKAAGGAGSSRNLFLPFFLALGTGVFLFGLGEIPTFYGIFLSIAGLFILGFPLYKLMPQGTLVARAGLPAIIASRGLFVAAYYGTQTYLVLGLTSVLGLSADKAGLAVASAAISWSVAANVQAKRDTADLGAGRKKRVVTGLSIMMIGVALSAPLAFIPNTLMSVTLAIISQIIMGFGIGLAHPTSGAIAFSLAKPGEEGKVSAEISVADTFTPAIGIGLGGAIITVMTTLGFSQSFSITIALLLQVLTVLLGLAAATRLPSQSLLKTEERTP
ncbi:MFS transporter [Brevibacillus reuszeri]|uniref:MFS transporter n=1 Tax=Brevibacillus reuszeri TaxID=54915 RepID=A0A0K9YTK0_9BACL|nr:MFS transporter [Brevibacillus reuszeri]KNB71525.1 MFS transporter [Brevibacillus reuszeri]MED1855668.1 MFS transporter [Brevibacillus reuszeri]GED67182.1 MFS transporter [Brevibacillus reuszeri]